jgi:Tfp pilus assembly protein PilX
MKRSPHRRPGSPRGRQRGLSTLIIAILLLAVVTIITLFAARIAVSEQRQSGNEYRYKIAFQVAEAGLNQSMEFVKMSTTPMLSSVSGGWLFAGDPHWQPCSNALPSTMAVDPCLAEPDSARRANMYRYVGNNASAKTGILPTAGVMPKLGVSTTTNDVDGFTAGYNAYATLCRLDMTDPDNPRCALNPTNGDTFYVTIVSQGTLNDENANAVVKQSFGTFRLLGAAPAAPLIAAGTSVGLGNAQIIPNPDAAGFGLPVSIWSKGNADVDSGASFASCQLGEWLDNYGNPAPSATDLLNGVCASCTCNGMCPGYGLLSGNAASCPAADNFLEGEDILDVDSGTSDAVPKLVDSKYFPPDLFAYTFGVPSSSATSYLDANATKITACSALTAASAGLYWYTGTTNCAVGTAGSLQNPVVLVSNMPVVMGAGDTFYGIIYVREGVDADLLKATGGPQIYGSVILEGSAKMAGNPTIVYNKAVLNNIRNSPAFVRYGPVPGSWSDTLQ